MVFDCKNMVKNRKGGSVCFIIYISTKGEKSKEHKGKIYKKMK